MGISEVVVCKAHEEQLVYRKYANAAAAMKEPKKTSQPDL